MTKLMIVREYKEISQMLLTSLSGINNIRLIRDFEAQERDINTAPAAVYTGKSSRVPYKGLLEDE